MFTSRHALTSGKILILINAFPCVPIDIASACCHPFSHTPLHTSISFLIKIHHVPSRTESIAFTHTPARTSSSYVHILYIVCVRGGLFSCLFAIRPACVHANKNFLVLVLVFSEVVRKMATNNYFGFTHGGTQYPYVNLLQFY